MGLGQEQGGTDSHQASPRMPAWVAREKQTLTVDLEDSPWRMKVWLVSSRMSQPSTIILSMARFFLMFSVSLTSSCMIL